LQGASSNGRGYSVTGSKRPSSDVRFCPKKDRSGSEALLMVTSKALRLGLAVCHLIAAGFYGEDVLHRATIESTAMFS
jgi:hypothetical protein